MRAWNDQDEDTGVNAICDAVDSAASAGCQGELALTLPVAIVGLGATGLACASFLHARGIRFSVLDTADAPHGLAMLRDTMPTVEVRLGPFDADWLRGMGTILLSPGVPLTDPAIAAARAAGVDVLGDIELFARVARAPIAAITGSNGKSTVTSLVARMVESAGLTALAGGNLGPPALALLDSDTPDVYVLELSSFQLESTASLDAAVAAVLNVSPDHMDRYADLAAYAAAKARVYSGHGVMVVNRDDPDVWAMVKAGRRVLSFGLDQPEDGHFGVRRVQGKDWLAHGHTLLARCDAVPLPGRHNLANALAALAIGESLGLSTVAMIGALLDFKGLEHRCELVGEWNGVRWFNDSKGTNVDATRAALEGLGQAGPLVLIAGGEGKGADFGPLARACAKRVHHAILFGRDAGVIEAALGGTVETARVPDLAAAIVLAQDLGRPGDAVLFSPACASYDMFRNYEERGRAFKALLLQAHSS